MASRGLIGHLARDRILAALRRKNYQPLKPKALARKLGVPAPEYPDFRRALKELLQQGRIEIAKNRGIQPVRPHGTLTGTYRRTDSGVASSVNA